MNWADCVTLLVGKLVTANLPYTPSFIRAVYSGSASDADETAYQDLIRTWVDAWIKKGFEPSDFADVIGDVAGLEDFPTIWTLTGMAMPNRDRRRARAAADKCRSAYTEGQRALPEADRQEKLNEFRKRMAQIDPEFDSARAKRIDMERQRELEAS